MKLTAVCRFVCTNRFSPPSLLVDHPHHHLVPTKGKEPVPQHDEVIPRRQLPVNRLERGKDGFGKHPLTLALGRLERRRDVARVPEHCWRDPANSSLSQKRVDTEIQNAHQFHSHYMTLHV